MMAGSRLEGVRSPDDPVTESYETFLDVTESSLCPLSGGIRGSSLPNRARYPESVRYPAILAVLHEFGQRPGRV